MDINLNNYEEYLLCYVDGELDEEQIMALMRFLKAHPDKQKELELLQMTVLPQEENIHFPGKASLYHAEKLPVKKAVFLRRYSWLAAAAAACIALLLVFYLQPAKKTAGVNNHVVVNRPAPDQPAPGQPSAGTPAPVNPLPTDQDTEAAVAVTKMPAPKNNVTKVVAANPKRVKKEKPVEKKAIPRVPAPANAEQKDLAADAPHSALPEITPTDSPVEESEAHETTVVAAITTEPKAGQGKETTSSPDAHAAKPVKENTARNTEVMESLALAKEDFDSTVTRKLTDINEKASGFINKIAKNGIKIGHVTFAINN